MEKFLEVVNSVNKAVNNVVWGPVMLILLIGTGAYLTIRTGCIQLTKFGYIWRNTIGSLFKKKEGGKGDGKNLTAFEAVTTALASTVGTGNIAGVTGAIFAGGPGAVFWMWVSAFFGMCTKYAEIALAMKFRNTDANGVHKGGPMYYIENGLGKSWKWLAVVFALLGGLASFGIGNIAQSSEISGALNGLFGLDPLASGILLTVLVAVVVIGGVKRIGQVTSLLVPFMSVFYVAAGVVVIAMRITDIPAVFQAIFTSAFSFEAVGGGVFGYAIMVAMKNGFARGVFSNEAGLGSSVMVHSSSNIKEPVRQGMWSIFEVFADTIVVCTLTAFCILSSGLVDLETGQMLTDVEGSGLVGQAFAGIFGPIGPKFIAIAILLFAYSTVLGWSHYGTKAFEFLFGVKTTVIYKIIFVIMTYFGCTASLGLAWDLSDTFNGLMMIPNLIGVLALSGTVRKITNNYIRRTFHGSKEEPMYSAFEDIQREQLRNR